MSDVIKKFYNKLCLDERIESGIFDIQNEEHLNVFQEYLEGYGIAKDEAVQLRNRMIEGKYPERQAYNKDGLLVTFPTPDYKKRAIARGTHFEKNPKTSQSAQTLGLTVQPPANTSTEVPPNTQPTTSNAQAPTDVASAAPPAPTPAPIVFEPPKESEPAKIPEPEIKTPEQKKAEGEYVEFILKNN